MQLPLQRSWDNSSQLPPHTASWGGSCTATPERADAYLPIFRKLSMHAFTLSSGLPTGHFVLDDVPLGLAGGLAELEDLLPIHVAFADAARRACRRAP